jgi:Leucine-rich repeat (LRR) protein
MRNRAWKYWVIGSVLAGALWAAGSRAAEEKAQPMAFNSQVALYVYAVVESPIGDEDRYIGRTPSERPLTIPPCKAWYVDPGPAFDMQNVRQAIQAHAIPGLRLMDATDADLEHLKGLTGLRYLDLQGWWVAPADPLFILEAEVSDARPRIIVGDGATGRIVLPGMNVTDAGVRHLKELTGLRYLDLSDRKVTDAGLAELKGLTALRTLKLTGTEVTDAGLEHLKGLPALQRLDLSRTQVTGTGLVHLKGITALQRLDLGSTRVTDMGLEHLKGFKGLQWLRLSGTRVTDAGLEQLKGLTALQHLYLGGTQVTDAGLEHLKGLTALRQLKLAFTQVTDAGIEQIKKSLPDLIVYR